MTSTKTLFITISLITISLIAVLSAYSYSRPLDQDRFLVKPLDFARTTHSMIDRKRGCSAYSSIEEKSCYYWTKYRVLSTPDHRNEKPFSFDFTPMEIFLQSEMDDPTQEGDPSSHWKVIWNSAARTIQMEGKVLPNSDIEISYHEVLK